eukprot:COSAG01_NODE_9164_length_2532_cov_1.403617_3_plen_62_part_00
MYPAERVALPVQRALDLSIDPIAWTEFAGLGGTNPYNVTNTDQEVKTYHLRVMSSPIGILA